MNILYIDPKMKIVGKNYPVYSGVFNELEKIAACYLYEGECKDIEQVIKECPFIPDSIIFGIGWFASHTFEKIKGLDEINIPVVCCMFKDHLELQEKLYFMKVNKVDQILTPLSRYKKYEEQTGVSAKVFPCAADPNIFKKRPLEKIYDFGFSGALHDDKYYIPGSFRTKNMREKIQNLLKSQENLNCFLNGSDEIQFRILNKEEYAEKINQSKIWLSPTAPFEDMPTRYYEIGLSGTLIFTNRIPEAYRSIFQDGINCVEFSDDLSDFLDKVHYYLKNDEERQKIINNAYTYFHKNHTWKIRAKELLDIISLLENKYD